MLQLSFFPLSFPYVPPCLWLSSFNRQLDYMLEIRWGLFKVSVIVSRPPVVCVCVCMLMHGDDDGDDDSGDDDK